MNPDTSSSQSASPKRIESIAYYILLATIVLAPLAFWASPYVALDLVKTAVIGIGSLVSAILFGIIALDERRLALPPKSIAWTSSLIAVSLIISSLVSIHAGKSLFGQGFEIGTASFILATFVGALAAFTAVSRRLERGVIIYLGIVAAYVVLYAFHLLRFIFGPHFASFGILSSLTATVLGSWYALAAYSAVVLVISLSAIKFLPLSGRMRISYWALAVLSAVGMVIINDARVWAAATLLFLGMTVWIFVDRGAASAPIQGWFKRVLSRVSWVFLVALIVSAVFAWRGASIAGPVISKLNAGYTELTLPWQMTLDVTAGAIKNYPIFGVGPNHFSQAYLAYKPAGINQTDAWGVEFSNGFGTVPTFVATQGLTGAALWILFFVFFVILGLKALKRMPSSEPGRFLVVSSFWSSALLWLIAIASTPPHAMLFLTLVMTGIFFGSAVSSGALQGSALAPVSGTRSNKMFPSFVAIMILVLAIWGVVIMKKTVALSYFAAGVKQLTVDGAPANADADFAKALAFDSSDVYWQARAEATMSMATKLAGTVNAQTAASTSQAVLSQVVALVNQANGYAQKAVAYDP
ncbi:MAG: hypothetical protein KGI66_04710, partial [Patescibacteria group bacterium]|nr:hypothetical protein [Patescibacteria group bacterium]